MAGLSSSTGKLRRRDFLLQAGAMSAIGASCSSLAFGEPLRVLLVPDSTSPLTATQPVRWATSELLRTIESKHISGFIADGSCDAGEASIYIAIGARDSDLRKGFGSFQVSADPESLRIAAGTLWGKPALLVDGSDASGLMYGLLELASRVNLHGVAALTSAEAIAGQRQTRSAACHERS